MRKVKVMTDSGADLPKWLAEKHGIDVIPARIILGSKGYSDDGTLTTKELFEFADSEKMLPTTAPASVYQFQEAFQKWLAEDYDIFFIGVSGKLAETVNNALLATAKLAGGRICIVDSLNISSGTGLQALEAAELAEKGLGLQEITEKAYALRPKVQASIMLDTLKYVYIGGRCSRLASVMGDTMNIKPVICVKDGDMVLGDHFRGKSSVGHFLEQALKEQERIDTNRIFVTKCFESNASEIEERLRFEFGFKNVIVADASPAISVHCGLGALGIMFRYK